MDTIPYQALESVEMRVGRVVQVDDFPEARRPAYKLMIDFGEEIGLKKSSAQITDLYTKEYLLHRLVVCIVNLTPKQIGPFMSECLTLGVHDVDGNVALLSLEERDIPLGAIIC